jgi:hypothetical protein
LRSAGGLNGVVFFAGPDMTYGSTVFAYSTDGNKYLGCSHFKNVVDDPEFTIINMRKWLVIDGVLYCGVRYKKGDTNGGALLRWTGSRDDPFKFEIAGYAENELAELVAHNGCIYAGGWPATNAPAAIYASQAIPDGGFTAANYAKFEKVWDYSKYEPDAFQKGIVGVGGMKSFKGRLYWGMLSITWANPFYAKKAYKISDDDQQAYLNAVIATMRATTLFSATDFSTPNDVEMLYGESELPKYNYAEKKWEIVPNASSYVPKWGRSGYGNLFNNYTWAMEEYDGKLYIGTMDWQNIIVPFLSSFNSYKSVANVFNYLLKKETYGYDLIVLKDNDTEPTMLTYNGFNNDAAYGIRNLLKYGNNLYIGTANPLNLHSKGGWQLMSINLASATNIKDIPKSMTVLLRCIGDNMEITSLDNSNISDVNLYDNAGRCVFSQSYNDYHVTIATGSLVKGIYVANINTKGNSYKVKCYLK